MGTTSSWMDGDSVVRFFLFSSGCLLAGVQRGTFSGVLGVRERARVCKELYGSSLVYFIFRHVFRYPTFLARFRRRAERWRRRRVGHDGSCWRWLLRGVGAAVLLLMTRIKDGNMLDSVLCRKKEGGC